MPGKRRLSAYRGAYESQVGFYDLRQVLDLYPVSKATLYREIARKQFPAQTQLTRNRVGWAKAAVDRFLAERAGGTP